MGSGAHRFNGGSTMIYIADDQTYGDSIRLMKRLIGDPRRWKLVSYLDKDNCRRPESEVAKDICDDVLARMIRVLPQDVREALNQDLTKVPESEKMQITKTFKDYVEKPETGTASMDGIDTHSAFMIDLSARSINPDTSYGLRVIRELALLLKPNHESNPDERIRRAIREFYGDTLYLTVFYSHHRFDLQHVPKHWFLTKEQVSFHLAQNVTDWIEEPFQHSSTCPVIYTVNRNQHEGKIIPRIMQWELL